MGVRIDYRLIGYGFARCAIEIDGNRAELQTSYLGDALRDLAKSVADLLAGSECANVCFPDEPGEYTLQLGRQGDDLRVVVTGENLDTEDELPEPVVFLDSATRLGDFARATLQALDALLMRHGLGGYGVIWAESSFPVEERARIRVALGLSDDTDSLPTGGWLAYSNGSGFSRIIAYEVGPDFLRVLFPGETAYTYSAASAGADNVAEMKRLAQSGEGLLTYINANVRYAYASKEQCCDAGPVPRIDDLLFLLNDSIRASVISPRGFMGPQTRYCIARLVRDDRGYGVWVIPEGCSFRLLASPGSDCQGVGGEWGLVEISGFISGNVGLIVVSDDIADLIDNAKSYPPAIAIARDVIDDLYADATPTIDEFLDRWTQEVRSIMTSQPTDGYTLLEALVDEPGYLSKGSFYWVLDEGQGSGVVRWVDDVNFYAYQRRRDHFAWPGAGTTP